jgi:hypothetical protein
VRNLDECNSGLPACAVSGFVRTALPPRYELRDRETDIIVRAGKHRSELSGYLHKFNKKHYRVVCVARSKRKRTEARSEHYDAATVYTVPEGRCPEVALAIVRQVDMPSDGRREVYTTLNAALRYRAKAWRVSLLTVEGKLVSQPSLWTTRERAEERARDWLFENGYKVRP